MQYPDLYQYYNAIHPIPAAEWEEFEPNFSLHHFRPNDVLVKAGDTADTMYVLLDGIVKTFYEDQAGREYVKIFLSAFEIASPYLEIVNRVPSKCHIAASRRPRRCAFAILIWNSFFGIVSRTPI